MKNPKAWHTHKHTTCVRIVISSTSQQRWHTRISAQSKEWALKSYCRMILDITFEFSEKVSAFQNTSVSPYPLEKIQHVLKQPPSHWDQLSRWCFNTNTSKICKATMGNPCAWQTHKHQREHTMGSRCKLIVVEFVQLIPMAPIVW